MVLIQLSSLLALFAGQAYGWGASGHQAVGYIAMQFLAPNALSFVTTSLGSTYNQSLGPAATWADSVKYSTGYTWSAPLHYVDAQDSPPTTCSVSQTRDCATGNCILSAIANYTSRTVDTTLTTAQRQEALKFLDHFLGDIGQPLHNEYYQVGGNDIAVTCNGASTNLHYIWDTSMINKLLSTNYGNSVSTWVNSLVSRIKTGDYSSSAANWISCSSTTQPARKRSIDDDLNEFMARSITPLACPLVWSSEANTYVCSYVLDFIASDDLCAGSYYTGAVPIIEEQIAKQGYRLAAWLNVLFDGSTHLP